MAGTETRLMTSMQRAFQQAGFEVPEIAPKELFRVKSREVKNAANTTRDPLDGVIGSSTASSEACACESAAKHQVQNCYEGEKCQVEGCDELSVRSQSGSKRDSKLCVMHRDEREKAMAEQKAEQKAAHEAKKAAKSATGKKLIPGRGFFQPASDRPDKVEDEMEVVEQVAFGSAEEEVPKVTERQTESEIVAKSTAREAAREEANTGLSKLTIPDSTDVDIEAVAQAAAENAVDAKIGGIEYGECCVCGHEGILQQSHCLSCRDKAVLGLATEKARKAADDRYATKEDVAEAIEISNEAILDRLDKIQSDTISLVHAYTAQPEQIVNATIWAQLDADLQAISEITGRRVN